ncbi:hypothetical protein [Streptomyces sp. NPDC059894]|uniref:hypothetical protein n=1 Tax=unclassified Streptomyces TaxID=2593676 RepID=UPI003646525C
MSSAYAGTDLTAVMPDVSAYGYPPDAGLTLPDTGSVPDLADTAAGDMTDAVAGQATDAVDQLGGVVGDAVDAVTDQLRDMIVPALIGLADLSGALLVTRLALRGTEALAAFNNRVAAEQEAMARRQMSLEMGSECWRRAAETAAGLNARITVLGLEPRGPGEPPLPAPVQPVGVPLDVLWKRLAATERVVRRVETQRASRATARLPFRHTEDPAHAEWYDRLRERRRQALLRYAEGGSEPVEAAATRRGAAVPDTAAATTAAATTGTTAPGTPATGTTAPGTAAPGTTGGLTEEDVLREGADLLAGLPLAFTSESRELIDDCLLEARRAVPRRPSSVRRYLDEAALIARKESERARRTETVRRDAALRLGVLQAPPPEGIDPLPDASPAVDVLRRVLRDGVPPSAADERTVRQALVTRSAALQRAYVVAALRRATERWGEGSVHARADAEHWDFAPAAWGGRYWLRVRLTAGGQAKVFTMRRPLSQEEAADPATVARWEALDEERCAESAGYVDQLGALTEAEGVRAEFTWSRGQVLPGEPAPGLTESAPTATTGRDAPAGHLDHRRRTPPARRPRPAQPRHRRQGPDGR